MDWVVELTPQGELLPPLRQFPMDDTPEQVLIAWPGASDAAAALETANQTICRILSDARQRGITIVEFEGLPPSLVCALAEPLRGAGISTLCLPELQIDQCIIDALTSVIATLDGFVISLLDFVPVLPMKAGSELNITSLRASSLPDGCWWGDADTVTIVDAPHLTRIDAVSDRLQRLWLARTPSLLRVTTSATNVSIQSALAFVELTATRPLTFLDVITSPALARVNLRSGFGASPTVVLHNTGTLRLPWADSIFRQVDIDNFDVPGICADFRDLSHSCLRGNSLAWWKHNLGVQAGTRDQCIASMAQRVNRRSSAMILIIAGRRRARALARALPRELWDLVFYEFIFQ
jgi:hypothetical protein